MSDLISRQDAIDKAILIPIAKIVTEDKVIYRRIVFVEDIESLPSAERIGHWIELYENNYQCSECNAWWTCEDTPIASGMNFCPNCGARMKGEEE